MAKARRWLVACVLVSCLGASAHLCNNIYRTPDRVIVKSEKSSVALDRTDEFRAFVQNNYHTYLHNLRLTVTVEGAAGVTVEVTPAAFRELKAGERVAFDLRLTAQPGAPRGERKLVFGVTANEIGFQPVQQATVDELAKAAENPNHSPGFMAAESLVQRGDPRGAEKLRLWCTRDRGDYRSRAIRALGKGGDRTQIPFLRELLTDRDGFARGNALLSLGLLRDDPATFLPFLNDRDEFVKHAALAGLSLSGSTMTGLDARLRAALSSDNVYVRIACGWALAAKRQQVGIDALDAAFRTNDPQQRVCAGDAMVDVANRPAAGARG